MLSLRTAQRVLALASLISLGNGCDDGESVTLREQKCGEICERYEMCNDQTDLTGCKSDCSAEAFRSDAYFEAKASCVSNLSCNRLIERDQSAQLNDCIGDDLRDKELGPGTFDLCTSLSNKLSACVATVDPDAVQSSCESTAVTLSEDYLVDSEDCSELRCSEISSCLAELADTFDTQVMIYSGKSTK